MNIDEINMEITRLRSLDASPENLLRIAQLHADRYVLAGQAGMDQWVLDALIVCHSDALRSALIARGTDSDGMTKCPERAPHSPHRWWYGADPLTSARCPGIHRG